MVSRDGVRHIDRRYVRAGLRSVSATNAGVSLAWLLEFSGVLGCQGNAMIDDGERHFQSGQRAVLVLILPVPVSRRTLQKSVLYR